MKNMITIRNANQMDYDAIIAIMNESFIEKFSFVIPFSKLKYDFAHDFGIVDVLANNKEFVALDACGKVLGSLSLRFKGQENYESPNLPFIPMLQKYGWKAVIRAIKLGRIMTYKPPKGELHIENIAVAKEARSLGVGTQLMAYAETFAQQHGYSQISLKVMFENEKAKKLYERLGFQVKSKESMNKLKDRTGFSGAFFMVKKLK